jgi:hypothetical protein
MATKKYGCAAGGGHVLPDLRDVRAGCPGAVSEDPGGVDRGCRSGEFQPVPAVTPRDLEWLFG